MQKNHFSLLKKLKNTYKYVIARVEIFVDNLLIPERWGKKLIFCIFRTSNYGFCSQDGMTLHNRVAWIYYFHYTVVALIIFKLLNRFFKKAFKETDRQ